MGTECLKNNIFRIILLLTLAVGSGLLPSPALHAAEPPEGASVGFSVRLEIRRAARVTDHAASSAAGVSVPTGAPATPSISVSRESDAATPVVTLEAAAGAHVQPRMPQVVETASGEAVYRLPDLEPEVTSVTWVLIYQ